MLTPYLSIDFAKLRANINRMQELCDKHGCKLRPHIKTHKSVEIARMQVAAGAVGITCAKVSEAEVMAAGGLSDIFIAYPLVGAEKIERAIVLAKKLRRLILAVDSLQGAEALSLASRRHELPLQVRLEVDSGMRRSGVSMRDAADLAVAVSSLPGLQLSGLYTFKGMMHGGKATMDAEEAATEECRLLYDLKQELGRRGVEICELSAGSTPTGPACAATGLVDEIRPGTYVFYDQSYMLMGAATPEDIAARIVCTVVSTPAPDYAIVDGGSKTFPTDAGIDRPPLHLHSYGYAIGRDDLRLDRLSEEHGMLRSVSGETGLSLGDILEFVPAHICPAVNLQNHMYVSDEARMIRVDARGMLV